MAGRDQAGAAKKSLFDRYDQRDRLNLIGKEVPRLDAVAKVTGAAVYTHDVILPGMLHGILVRSPHASATVMSVSTAAAEAMPGVRAVLAYSGKRVRFAGDEVAAVAADTLSQARDAARAIQVSYEVYDAVVTVDDALADGAPQVYDGTENARQPFVSERGDVEGGFADADAVIEADYTTQVQTHSPMETHVAVAQWEGADQLTVWQSTQGIFSSRSEFASHFSLPSENVRVICDYIGGGFGSKISAGTYGVICAELARRAGLPVKVIVDRKGEQLSTGNRPDSIQHVKVGARSDGTLTAIEVTGFGTAGVGSGAGFAAAARELYEFEAYRTSEVAVYTHGGPSATMRAPGHPQGVFSVESAIDELAYELGMDPVELRLKNDSYPVRRKQFEYAGKKFGWESRNPLAGADEGPVKRGMGVASTTWTNGGFPGFEVRVTVSPQGDVLVENGTQDIGTGTRTWMAMLVAEELGLPLSRVQISIGDTDFPKGCFAGGSSTTPSMAAPTREAGANAALALAEVVAADAGVDPQSLSFEDGEVVFADGRSLAFSEACALLTGPLVATGTRTDRAKVKAETTTGVQFAEVEVDTRTGKITVLRVTAMHDAGRILNRLTAESQVIGGVIGGLNYALFEERVMDRATGIMLNANLEAYKIGGSRDMPVIDPILSDIATGGTYVGALGLGEPPFIPTAAAIANAVRHAIGVRVYGLPMTPARVLEALGTLEATGAARRGGRR